MKLTIWCADWNMLLHLLPEGSTYRVAYIPYTLLWDGPFPWGDPDRHLIYGYCGPPHPTCQVASRFVQPFSYNTSAWPKTDRQTMNNAKYRSRIPTFCWQPGPKNTVILILQAYTQTIHTQPFYGYYTGPAHSLKNWRILLEQSSTAHMPLLSDGKLATNTLGLGRKS